MIGTAALYHRGVTPSGGAIWGSVVSTAELRAGPMNAPA